MDNPLTSLDWSLVQAFIAVAETGSLSAAARATGISQPTLGRQVHRIEQVLGATLFHRHPRGLSLTGTGRMLMPAAEAMREAAGRMSVIAAGQDARLEGEVRLTASDVVSHFILPPVLAGLRAAEPGIHIDLTPSDSTENLLFREADIAIRMFRPEQLDMVTRHIADMALGIFAAESYLDRAGRPERVEEMFDHDMVGYDRNDLIIRGIAEMGWRIGRDHFTTRCDDQAAYWHLVRAGCGIGFSPVAVGRAEPGMVRLFPDLPIPPLPVWLTAHEAMRRTPRIRRVWDHLAEALPQAVS